MELINLESNRLLMQTLSPSNEASLVSRLTVLITEVANKVKCGESVALALPPDDPLPIALLNFCRCSGLHISLTTSPDFSYLFAARVTR